MSQRQVKVAKEHLNVDIIIGSYNMVRADLNAVDVTSNQHDWK